MRFEPGPLARLSVITALRVVQKTTFQTGATPFTCRFLYDSRCCTTDYARRTHALPSAHAARTSNYARHKYRELHVSSQFYGPPHIPHAW